MSFMSTISRYGAALQKARRETQSIRMLNRLPAAVQKDIGWPAPEDGRQRSAMSIFRSQNY